MAGEWETASLTDQLDFDESMHHFRAMFPTMDDEVCTLEKYTYRARE